MGKTKVNQREIKGKKGKTSSTWDVEDRYMEGRKKVELRHEMKGSR